MPVISFIRYIRDSGRVCSVPEFLKVDTRGPETTVISRFKFQLVCNFLRWRNSSQFKYFELESSVSFSLVWLQNLVMPIKYVANGFVYVEGKLFWNGVTGEYEGMQKIKAFKILAVNFLGFPFPPPPPPLSAVLHHSALKLWLSGLDSSDLLWIF